MFVPMTPLDFKDRAVRLFGNKVGVIDGERRFTYAEFGERVHRLANALHSLGLEPGDRVAYLAYNSHPLLEGYFGVLEAGGVLLPINIRLTAHEIAYILEDSAARFLFIDPDFANVVGTLRHSLRAVARIIPLAGAGGGDAESNYEELLAVASPLPSVPAPVDENAVVELFYTSGTTGRPKGVMLTNRNLYVHALTVLAGVGTTDADVQLHTIPLFHVNGWGTPQSLTAVGGTHVMLRRFDPGEALRLIEQEHVTRFYAVPTMLNMLLSHPDLERRDLRSLRLVVMGGSATPPEMVRRAESLLGCRVEAGYGLSETTPVLTHARFKAHLIDTEPSSRIERQASTGLPGIGIDLRVIDDNGREVAWDGASTGEIVVRANVVMAGYWNDPDATESVIRDGWFHTGDMAVVDGEGYVTIVDRKKDIIISGGENISSVEIEKVLYEHPAVLESAVIGIPDDYWGEAPIALVVRRPGSTVEEDGLISFCRARLAAFKVPKQVVFSEALPKGGTGKILKAQLREPYWSSERKRVR